MYNKVLIVWLLCFLLIGVISFGQNEDTTKTSLDIIWITPPGEEPIDIEKADRVFYKVSVKPEVQEVRSLEYTKSEFNLDLRDLNPKMRIPKMPGGKVPLLYGNYFKLGFGNYITPLAELYLGSKRNEKYSYGLNLNHLSSVNGPIDKSNSGYSTNSVNAFGNIYTNNITLGSNISYDRGKYRFYGYPSDSNNFSGNNSRVINSFGFEVNAKTRKLNDGFTSENLIGLNSKSDNLGVSDLLLNLESQNEYVLSDKVDLGFKLGTDFNNYKIEDSVISRYLIGLNLQTDYKLDNMVIRTGLLAQLTDDTLSSGRKFHIYPDLRVDYKLNNSGTKLFAELNGKSNWNNWSRLIETNPVLQKNISILNQNDKIHIGGGVSGIFKSKLTYSASIGYKRIENLATYKNDSLDPSQFEVIYDQIGASNIYTKANFNYKFNDKIRGDVSVQLNQWNTEGLEAAWHLPNTEAKLNLRYKILDNMYINTDFYYISGIQAFDFDLNSKISLGKITDLSVGVDYLVGSKFSCFMNFNNILSGNYQRYFKYPSQGINLLGGLTYTF